MQRNTSGQKWRVFYFNRQTGEPVLGAAADLSAKISIDFTATTPLDNQVAVEIEDGYYYFSLTKEETNGNSLELFPDSSSPGKQVIGDPPSFSFQAEPEVVVVDGATADLSTASKSYGPKRVKTPNLEVEQFSPLEIQRARDRESLPYPSLASCGMSIAEPNHEKYRSSCPRCG